MVSIGRPQVGRDPDVERQLAVGRGPDQQADVGERMLEPHRLRLQRLAAAEGEELRYQHGAALRRLHRDL
jgi:hypothetical protein